jgi:hypothetical protein
MGEPEGRIPSLSDTLQTRAALTGRIQSIALRDTEACRASRARWSLHIEAAFFSSDIPAPESMWMSDMLEEFDRLVAQRTPET